MQITIKGKTFTVAPVGNDLGAVLMKEAQPDVLDRRNLYDWDCRTGKGGNVNEDAGDGKLTVPVLTVFHVGRKGQTLVKDIDASVRMQILTMALLKVPLMGRLRALTEARFGQHELPVDLSAFDWLKPFARFRLYAVIKYKWFRATAVGTPQYFYVGLPHELAYDPDITGYCNMLGVLKALKEQGKTLSLPETVGTSDKPESAEARKAHLEAEKADLERKTGAADTARLEEIEKELEELSPAPEEEPEWPGAPDPFDWEMKPPTHSGD